MARKRPSNHGDDNIENLIGGSGNDLYFFRMGLFSTGTITGDGGVDALDLFDYSTAVSVNLATGIATAVWSFSGIQDFGRRCRQRQHRRQQRNNDSMAPGR